ncbi:hypothetical protein F4780DRAFT_54417 [Xylariomycetidae sp. FL0641]|nr:hypothetical protein F4780DRAFT_54417 [Xylariomycetidae sp. FL0641]
MASSRGPPGYQQGYNPGIHPQGFYNPYYPHSQPAVPVQQPAPVRQPPNPGRQPPAPARQPPAPGRPKKTVSFQSPVAQDFAVPAAVNKPKNKPPAADPATMSDSDESECREWTQEEDRTVAILQSKGKKWAQIGKKLDRDAHDIWSRYQHLKGEAAKMGLKLHELAKIYEAQDAQAKAEESKKKNQGGKKEESSSSSSSSSSSESESSSESSSSSEESQEDRPILGRPINAHYDPRSEVYQQKRYFWHVVLGRQFPPREPLPRPDRFWSADDCRTLGVVVARQHALHWHFVACEFANATGRMIEPYILQAKFEEEEVPAELESSSSSSSEEESESESSSEEEEEKKKKEEKAKGKAKPKPKAKGKGKQEKK